MDKDKDKDKDQLLGWLSSEHTLGKLREHPHSAFFGVLNTFKFWSNHFYGMYVPLPFIFAMKSTQSLNECHFRICNVFFLKALPSQVPQLISELGTLTTPLNQLKGPCLILRLSFLFSTSLWQKVQNCKAIWRFAFRYLFSFFSYLYPKITKYRYCPLLHHPINIFINSEEFVADMKFALLHHHHCRHHCHHDHRHDHDHSAKNLQN